MKSIIRIPVLLAGWFAAMSALAADWQTVDPDSRIGFVATYEETPFNAWFRSFDARIRFDPDALDDAAFDIRMDVTSVDSNSPDRDEGMKQKEWFAAGEHPEARFRAERFERIAEGRYRAIGELSLKDVSRTIEVPFTWEQSGSEALLTVESEVNRGDFNIGTGEWEEDDTIGFTVTIQAQLKLTRR